MEGTAFWREHSVSSVQFRSPVEEDFWSFHPRRSTPQSYHHPRKTDWEFAGSHPALFADHLDSAPRGTLICRYLSSQRGQESFPPRVAPMREKRKEKRERKRGLSVSNWYCNFKFPNIGTKFPNIHKHWNQIPVYSSKKRLEQNSRIFIQKKGWNKIPEFSSRKKVGTKFPNFHPS